jgi:hypothetical protein
MKGMMHIEDGSWYEGEWTKDGFIEGRGIKIT